ncbi:MAG: 2-hydroxyacid dehydrogenase [Oceanococcus sp.]
MHKVFVSRKLPGPALQQLAERVELQCWPENSPPSPQALQQAVSDCDGLLCTLNDKIDQDLLDAAPKLRVVSSCSVGVDHVDIAALNARGIPLGYTPHVLTEATADLAFALLLCAARRLNEGDRFTRNGGWAAQRGWDPELLLGRDLHGATLGLLGLGPIGQAMARRAQGFGIRVIGWNRSTRQVTGVENHSFEEVIAQSDFLSLHLALCADTRHIINAKTLQQMPDHAILINSARGALIDEQALISALRKQQIAAAALDVFEHEPITPEHPLLALPNAIIAPHLGSATRGTRVAMAQLAVDNLLAGLEGLTMPQCVNPQATNGQQS